MLLDDLEEECFFVVAGGFGGTATSPFSFTRSSSLSFSAGAMATLSSAESVLFFEAR